MISVLVPTRGRPASVRRLVDSAYAMASGEIEFVFYIDDDDQESRKIISELGETFIVGPRIVMSDMWNHCARAARGDIMMLSGDDAEFKTENWDTQITDVFNAHPDRIVLVYCDDSIHGPNMATHPFIHRNWIEAVGRFTAPYFSCDYADKWLSDVADLVGRKVYVPSMRIQHYHPDVGTAEVDQTHRERQLRGVQDQVNTLYLTFSDERQREAEKLQRFIADFQPKED